MLLPVAKVPRQVVKAAHNLAKSVMTLVMICTAYNLKHLTSIDDLHILVNCRLIHSEEEIAVGGTAGVPLRCRPYF